MPAWFDGFDIEWGSWRGRDTKCSCAAFFAAMGYWFACAEAAVALSAFVVFVRAVVLVAPGFRLWGECFCCFSVLRACDVEHPSDRSNSELVRVVIADGEWWR